jgi:hypothetical protein
MFRNDPTLSRHGTMTMNSVPSRPRTGEERRIHLISIINQALELTESIDFAGADMPTSSSAN